MRIHWMEVPWQGGICKDVWDESSIARVEL